MANGNPFFVNPLGGQGPNLANQLQGLGAVLRENREKQEQQDYMARASAAAQEAFESGDPRKMAQASIQYPEIADRLKNAFGFTNETTQNIAESTYASVLSNPEGGVEALRRGIEQVRAAGGNPTNMENDLQAMLNNPEAALRQIELGVAGVAPQVHKAYTQQQAAARKAEIEQRKANIEARKLSLQERNINSQIALRAKQAEEAAKGGQGTAQQRNWAEYQRLKKTDPEAAKQFGEASGFVREGKELSVHLQKRLSEATDTAIESQSNAESYRGLAQDFDEADISGGVFGGSWRESMKDFTGQQDAATELRKKYNSIRGSQVVNNLPPGAASDTDIQLALSGFPTDNATGPQIASFLRGLSKLEEQKAKYELFKAEYISEKKGEEGLATAWRTAAQEETGVEPSIEDLVNKYGN